MARTEAFSDGVFAIAITLLVIEIGVPHLEDEPEGTTLVGALMDRWPSYLGYVISFLVIGTVWANHHNRFRFIVRSDHVLLFLNTLFLMWIEKIMRTVLHEAHGWQVEETMDTLSEGPEIFYSSYLDR